MSLDEKNKEILKEKFKELENKVELYVFTNKDEKREFNKEAQEFTIKLMDDLVSLHDNLTYKEFNMDSEEAKAHGIENNPTVIIQPSKYKIHYRGAPLGHEFGGFVETIINVSKGVSGLSDETKEKIKDIKKTIQVFVTPTCPYCAKAVLLANKMAMENTQIKAECVEATENPELASKHNVSSVPQIVIDGTHSFLGALAEAQFVNEVVKND